MTGLLLYGCELRSILFLFSAISLFFFVESSAGSEAAGILFDEQYFSVAETADSASELEIPEPFYFSGQLTFGSSYNLSSQSLQQGRAGRRGPVNFLAKTRLGAEYRVEMNSCIKIEGHLLYDLIHELRKDGNYSVETPDIYHFELELDEFYFTASPLPSVDIKLGRQVMAWGRADLIRVTDILNPLDMRQPEITDIEEIRLPVTMGRVDLWLAPWMLTALVIPETRSYKLPAAGQRFASVSTMRGGLANSLADFGYALAVNGTFSKWGVSFYLANTFDKMPAGRVTDGSRFPSADNRSKMYGFAADFSAGNMVIKTETACFTGITAVNDPIATFSRMDLMLGIDYSGFADSRLSVEAAYISPYSLTQQAETDPAQQKNWQLAIQAERIFARESISLRLLTFFIGLEGDWGGYQKLEIEYDISDDIEFAAGLLLFQPVMAPLFAGDRLFCQLTCRF